MHAPYSQNTVQYSTAQTGHTHDMMEQSVREANIQNTALYSVQSDTAETKSKSHGDNGTSTHTKIPTKVAFDSSAPTESKLPGHSRQFAPYQRSA